MKFLPVVLAAAGFLLVCCVPASAQLRPLEPFHWDVFFDSAPVHVYARIAGYDEQRASLAGTIGQLVELGEVRAAVRAGSVVLEFAGTPQRFFDDEVVFAPPVGGAASEIDGERRDAGDYRVATAVPLSARNAPWLAVLRFGTRLPTTDNRVGLDRDQTDFFALLGAQYRRSDWRFAIELGLGINGTRSQTAEQSDVMLYAGTLEYVGRWIVPKLVIVGQDDLRERGIRGNEDLSELRASVRTRGKQWLEAAFVRGLREFSPRAGVWIGGGFSWDW